MSITNPGVIVFCNEDMRPFAEWLRKLKAVVTAMNDEWNSVFSSVVPDDPGEQLIDGRESEGVTQVYGDEMHDLMSLSVTIETALSTAGNEELLSKFSVRPLRL